MMSSKILEDYNVLITGINGFLGKQFLTHFLENQVGVCAVLFDKHPEIIPEDIKNNKNFSSITIKNDGSFVPDDHKFNLSKKKNVMIHLAGCADIGFCNANPAAAFKGIVGLTYTVLEFCHQNSIEKIIYPSTGLLYGDNFVEPAIETNKMYVTSIYTANKQTAEELVKNFGTLYNMSTIVLRLSNIYSQYSKVNTVIGRIVGQLNSEEKIELFSLTPVRDFIHVDDIIAGVIKLTELTDAAQHMVINMATQQGVTIEKLAQLACEVRNLPYDLIKSVEGQDYIYSYVVLDNSKLIKLTGWKPEITLIDGLRSFLSLTK